MFKLCFTNAWGDFSNAILCKWDVVEFFITHQEGHVASARLVVGNFSPPEAAYLGIFDDETLLFQGVISGQFEHHQRLTKVEVLGISPTFEADLKTLLAAKSLEYNPAFFQGKDPKPSDYLESYNTLFYWNKITGKIGLSDYFKGNSCVDVSGQYIERSFKIAIILRETVVLM